MKAENGSFGQWFYYNGAVLSKMAPHETTEINKHVLKSIWKFKWPKKPMMVRYTSCFDCGIDTGWYYVIKDSPFDIQDIKSKRRNVINNGKKNFEVVVILPEDYLNELYNVQIAAYSSYPSKYQPHLSLEESNAWFANVTEEIKIGKKIVFGAFLREDKSLKGYIVCGINDNYVAFNVLRVDPMCENKQINAALVAGMLEYFNTRLSNERFYICDGERSINHETHFQDYLEKYFGFRKAYCKLNIYYSFSLRIIIALLFPLRKIFFKMDRISFIHKMNGVFKMEAIKRGIKDE